MTFNVVLNLVSIVVCRRDVVVNVDVQRCGQHDVQRGVQRGVQR